MTQALYLGDSYLKVFSAKVVGVDGRKAYLDKTAFYPTGGGQPHDTGTLTTADGTAYKVIDVKKTEQGIAHELDRDGLKEGDEIQGAINWERRYKLMQMHTSAHALCAVIHDETGAKITGHGLGMEESKSDFSLETFDRDQIEAFVKKCNEKLAEGKPVTFSYMKREEALRDPELVKLANVLPPAVKELRIVTIEGIDRQADGGTHVKNTEECGTIKIIKLENKGKGRKRIYFTLQNI